MQNFPVKIHIYTFCYNNEKLLPHVINYWQKYATHVVVYDNMSTDKSKEILKKYDWIEVRTYNSNNTYNPNLIEDMKNSCFKECIGNDNVDYVMVCDIDEVLLYSDKLMDVLKYRKSLNTKAFIANYYDVIKRDFPINSSQLVQNMNDVRIVRNQKFIKIPLFDPSIPIKVIQYQHNYLLQNENDIEKSGIYVLHLKLLGLSEYKEKQLEYVNRLAPGINSKEALIYGNDNNSCNAIFNFKNSQYYEKRITVGYLVQCLNQSAPLTRMVPEKETVIAEQPKKIEYFVNDIEYSHDSLNNDCVIAIIADKEIISDNEVMSLKRTVKLFKDVYDIVLICPEWLDLKSYNEIYDFNILRCSASYFGTQINYSKLMIGKDIYDKLGKYKFMLTLQLSSWVFLNNIKKFMMLAYDYVAAPRKVQNGIETIGSRISFKNIQKIRYALNKINANSEYANDEAMFFSKYVKNQLGAEFQVCPIECAVEFALLENEESWKASYGNKLPMACDYWEDKIIWNEVIPLLPREREDLKKQEELKAIEERRLAREAERKAEEERIRKEEERKAAEELARQKAEAERILKEEQEKQRQLQIEKERILKEQQYRKDRRAARLAKLEEKKRAIQEMQNEQQRKIEEQLKASAELINKKDEPVKVEEAKIEEVKIEKIEELHIDTANIDNDIHDSKILICIFNYRLDDNAKRWLHLLQPYYDTVVLDSGNDHEEPEFIQYPNIYYGGLWNEMKKLSEKKKYDWVGAITSDVKITDENATKLIHQLQWLQTTKNIGQYQPSFDENSYKWLNNNTNVNYKYESKYLLDGPIFFIKYDIFNEYPQISEDNKLGWGIGRCISAFVVKKKMLNIFDNTLQVTHEDGKCGYDQKEAAKTSMPYIRQIARQLKLDFNILKIKNGENNSMGEAYIIDNYIDYICETEKGKIQSDYSYDNKIIVTMTSWPKRINNVPDVLKTILSNTELPAKIVLNLSIEEFPEKENNLPQQLNDLISKNSIIEINWLLHNTMVWKKIFPTMFKYPNAYILCIDDDRAYTKTFIETFSKASKNKPNGPLSGADIKFYKSLIQHCGHSTLDRYDFYEKYLDFINKDVTNLMSSDSFYTFYANKCGHDVEYLGTNFNKLIREGQVFSNNDGYSKNHVKMALKNVFIELEKMWNIYAKTKNIIE